MLLERPQNKTTPGAHVAPTKKKKKNNTRPARGCWPGDHKRKFTLPRALMGARGGRVNCRRTRRTRHAPHLDLSPIFPLKYKTQTKIPRASRARRARGARCPLIFGNRLCACASIARRQGRSACAVSVCGAPTASWQGRLPVAAELGRRRTGRTVPGEGAGRVFHYSMLQQ